MIRVGTAGWALPADPSRFPAAGTHLERYAAVFCAVEINSSFHRPHRAATYARWAACVPDDFRFSVKIPKTVTHEKRLLRCTALLDEFLEPVRALGDKLGCLLVQLPPKLALNPAVAARFMRALRARNDGAIAIEARNESWFDARADALFATHRIARVAADPPRSALDGTPGGWRAVTYHRMHGSPRTYYSSYAPRVLDSIGAALIDEANAESEAWCIFDNTAARAAIPDALYLQEKLRVPYRGHRRLQGKDLKADTLLLIEHGDELPAGKPREKGK